MKTNYFKRQLLLFFSLLTASAFLFSGCSFEAKVKQNEPTSADGSTGANPSAPQAQASITSPLDPISESNKSAYPLSGTCAHTSSITIIINTNEYTGDIPCTDGSWSAVLNLSSLTEGNAQISIVNTGASQSLVTSAVTVDRTPPSSQLSSPPPALNNLTSVSSSVLSSDTASYSYKFNTASALDCSTATGYSSFISVGTALNLDLSSLSDDSYRLCLIGQDAAGNTQAYSFATVYNWTKDTSVPTATLTGAPSDPNNSASYNVVVGGANVSEYKYKIGLTGSTDCSSSSSYSSNIPIATALSGALGADGTYKICVVGKNAAGSWQAYSSATSTVWSYDSSAPVLSITSPTASSYLNTGSVSTMINCSENGRTVSLTGTSAIDSSTSNNTGTCSGGVVNINLNISALPSGGISLSASQSDLAGNTGTASSVNITKDVTPPVLGGTLSDGTYYNSTNQSPSLSWSAATDTNGIQKYQIALGTSSGGTQVLSWTDIGNVTTYSISGLSLVSGSTYYPSVRAVDPAGNESTALIGNGWIVDNVNPTLPGSFQDGILAFSTSESPSFSWTSSSDALSGLQGYQVAVGTSSGASDIMSWTSVGNVLSTSLSSMGFAGSLIGATKYYASVRSVDNAGNLGSISNGDSWYNLQQSKVAVDNTTPPLRILSGNANFGSSVAISEDQMTMVLGAPNDDLDSSGGNYLSNSGAAYVYIKSGGVWTLQQKIVAVGTNARVSDDYFGISVSISGETLVVGASGQKYDESGANEAWGAGAAFVFTRSGGVWSQQQKLVATGTNARMNSDNFGASVSINNDTVVVGSANHAYDESGANDVMSAGAAFVFTRSGSTWSQQQKLVATGTNARMMMDQFGNSVSISGETIVIGASKQHYDQTGANDVYEAGAAYVFTRSGGVWSQQQKLVATGANARMSMNKFGSSVSIHGETVVVGSPYNDYDESGANQVSQAGAVFVFTRSGGVWSQQQKLVATGTNARISMDEFGNSVSISSDTLAVGSKAQDFDETGANEIGGAGATYIFVRSVGVWSQQQKLVATGANARLSENNFGFGVAASGDSVVIGVPRHGYDQSGSNFFTQAGAAFQFTRSGAVWSQTQKVTDMQVPQNRLDLLSATFGKNLAISEDGNTVVVGVPEDDYDENGTNYLNNAGAVYVYFKSAGTWSLQQKLIPSGTNARNASDLFGSSVSISGDSIVVGATYHSYDENGANSLFSTGAAFVFVRSAGVWTQQQKLIPTGTNARLANDVFGWSVSISGETVAVGAPYQSYNATGAGYLNFAGAVYVFTRSGITWTQQQKLVPSGTNARMATDHFGTVVSLSGETVAIGAPEQNYDAAGANSINDSGAVFVFTRSGSTWSQQQKIIATGTNARVAWDNFGSKLALQGETITVGVPNQDYDAAGANVLTSAGAVFVYTRSGSTWSQQQRIVATGTNARVAYDGFGSSIGLKENTLAVGSPGQDYDFSGANQVDGAGATFVFNRNGSTWTQLQKITPTGTNSRVNYDAFGQAVCVQEDVGAMTFTIVVGAPNQDYNSSGAVPSIESGAIFIYH